MQENEFENVCKMEAILSRSQSVKVTEFDPNGMQPLN